MAEFFTWLGEAVQGAVPLALGAALVWGVLSILLSPCHLASIPLVVAYISEQGARTSRRAAGVAAVFASGILLTIALVGALTAALGRMLGDLGAFVNYALALVFLVLGLHFLGVLPMPWTGPGPHGARRRGWLGALLLGLVFGLGVGPCTFAYMAPMLGVTLKVGASSLLYAMALWLAFGVGHCAVIVAAGSSAPRVQRWLEWNEGSRGAVLLRQVCGVLVLLAGVYFVYTAP